MIDIAGRIVGSEHPCFVIAEAGVNHNGSIAMALQMVDVAVHSGADAIKFQTFKSERLVTRDAPKAEYQAKTTDAGESQLDMLSHLELSARDHHALMIHCQEKDIIFMSTPFDEESADMLIGLDVPVLKIPSGELNNLPYLRKIGGFRKKIIMSTGMANLEEIRTALFILTESGTPKEKTIVLHCNAEYPTPMEDVNLNAMLTIRDELGVKVGYSDHTLGIEIPIAAAAIGATVVEKHFTLSREMEGPDHVASVEPQELKAMVEAIRNIEKAMGDGVKKPSPSETKNIPVARKSIVAKKPIRKGESLTADNLTVKRPGTGISPMEWDENLGKTADREYEEDELIEN